MGVRGRKPRKFTNDEKDFIVKNYKTLSFKEIGKRLNTSRDVVSVWCKQRNYILTEEEKKLKQSNKLHFKPKFSKQQLQYIRRNYLKTSKSKMCRKFKCSHAKLDITLKYLGLTIPKEIIEERILNSRKTHPLGKGLSPEAYFGEEGVKKSLKYRFKKGNTEYLKQERFKKIKK